MQNCIHFENWSWLAFISLLLYTRVKLCLQTSIDEFSQPMSLYEFKHTVKTNFTAYVYIKNIVI